MISLLLYVWKMRCRAAVHQSRVLAGAAALSGQAARHPGPGLHDARAPGVEHPGNQHPDPTHRQQHQRDALSGTPEAAEVPAAELAGR